MKEAIIQSTIYIGLNDALSGEQKFDTQKYVSILKMVCHNFQVAFSFHIMEGGYFHENGMYVEETTLALMMINTPEETVMEIAKDLCGFFHQESVMVTTSPCSVVFVKEDVWQE